MFWIVVLAVAAFLLFAAGYRVRCAISPFTSKGRRRAPYWLRGWWRGEQAKNRGDWR